MHMLAKTLLDRETLNGAELRRLCGLKEKAGDAAFHAEAASAERAPGHTRDGRETRPAPKGGKGEREFGGGGGAGAARSAAAAAAAAAEAAKAAAARARKPRRNRRSLLESLRVSSMYCIKQTKKHHISFPLPWYGTVGDTHDIASSG